MTATSAEIQELKLNMGLRDVNTVVLRADLVQDLSFQILFQKVVESTQLN